MVSEEIKKAIAELTKPGLNPCYSGRWSRSVEGQLYNSIYTEVLILVIAVDGLGVGGSLVLEAQGKLS